MLKPPKKRRKKWKRYFYVYFLNMISHYCQHPITLRYTSLVVFNKLSKRTVRGELKLEWFIVSIGRNHQKMTMISSTWKYMTEESSEKICRGLCQQSITKRYLNELCFLMSSSIVEIFFTSMQEVCWSTSKRIRL